MQIGQQKRAGVGTQKLYDALGTQTDGAPTNRLLTASLDALDQRKPFIGYQAGTGPVGYDVLEDALADPIVQVNTYSAVVDQPVISAGNSVFANDALLTINEAIQVSPTETQVGSFTAEAGAKLYNLRLAPQVSSPSAVLQAFRVPNLAPTAFPAPSDCPEFRGGMLGYKLGVLGNRPSGYVLNNVQATAGTGPNCRVVYLYGTASVSGPIDSGTTIVQPPGVPMAFTGTSTAKQWVVTDRTYYTGGKSYKRIGATALVASLDDTDTANWALIAGGGTGGGSGTARDHFAVGDNSTITNAVLAATWVDGDLVAYANASDQNAAAPPAEAGQNSTILVGTADVATMDEFDMKDATGSAWRYRYSRRNDGTSGWTRIPKG